MNLNKIKTSLKELLKLYNFNNNCSLRFLCKSENITYLVLEDNIPKNIFRLCRYNYHTLEELQSELLFINILRNSFNNIIQPVKNTFGEYINVTNHGYVICFKFILGDTLKFIPANMKYFFNIGETIAKFHLAYINNLNKIKFNRHKWTINNIIGKNAIWGNWENAPLNNTQKSIIKNTLEIIKNRIVTYENLSEKNDIWGLIHSDIRSDNVIINDNKITIIDFDDCGYGYFLYDIAVTISFFEHLSLSKIAIKNCIKGYTSIRNLSPLDLSQLYTFIIMRRIQLLSWLYNQPDSELQKIYSKNFITNTITLCEDYINQNK